ncbi:hypothetical protein AB0I54_32560 [Streptomyces sp. NPDC050625]|uniref:hypothetical protein n=1 Tax=Streptomyces sp. NPDC050625 TaxID=3154629 RepID=UPI0034128A79
MRDSPGGCTPQLASVLTSAQQNLPPGQNASRDPGLQDLVGDVVPMPAVFGGRRLPGSLGGELCDMQASIKRRIKQLEGAQELSDRGYPVNDSDLFLNENPPDAKKVDDALRHLSGVAGQGLRDRRRPRRPGEGLR